METPTDAVAELEKRLKSLQERGVTILDPRQTYLDPAVQLERISAGAVLYPGTRLVGARTYLAPGAKVGTEGPATVENSVLGERSEVASGFVSGAVLLEKAKLGSNSHVREGTLLEEEASTAHAVGLKQTILMSYVTFGSLINFCDALVCGGTSRRDHSEVGSGFIHFNFTPQGKQGDKATPSLVGDVVRGMFLKEPRIFLGGMGGMVGPLKVGFGSITAAGQVARKNVPENHLVSEGTPQISKEFTPGRVDPAERRTGPNLEYIGNLVALKAWYEDVRLRRIPDGKEFEHLRVVTREAAANLELCIQERITRLKSFLAERVEGKAQIEYTVPPCPLKVQPDGAPYVEWVKSVPKEFEEQAKGWLQAMVAGVKVTYQ
ncbi:hypothetical protein [Geomonas sp.]|uniref:hypothetical protein n=1 Tax=Geomonas sp. TaxID=2651584 RepID=UPI002B48F5BE|nr:hypothetical protein [Geomonas sp.]HJV35437.1 hypothetical protein [Geomonas sp.]